MFLNQLLTRRKLEFFCDFVRKTLYILVTPKYKPSVQTQRTQIFFLTLLNVDEEFDPCNRVYKNPKEPLEI